MAVSGLWERIERMLAGAVSARWERAVSGFGERIERMLSSGLWERIERMR